MVDSSQHHISQFRDVQFLVGHCMRRIDPTVWCIENGIGKEVRWKPQSLQKT